MGIGYNGLSRPMQDIICNDALRADIVAKINNIWGLMVHYTPSIFELLVSRFQTDDKHARQALTVDRVIETQGIASRAIKNAFIGLRKETGISYKVGPPKELDRAQDKAKTDYNNDLSLVCDWARGKIVVDSPEQVLKIKEILSDPQSDFMKKHGLFVVQ